MVSYHKGDLLESGCEIICHQVNLQGVMGGGLARQIADKYPNCESGYKHFIVRWKEDLLKSVYYYITSDESFVIANCFSQEENFNTNYEAVKKCFEDVRSFALGMKYKTIGVPKNYGCGIAHGEWLKVKQIFKDIFEKEINIELQIWELDK